MRWLDLNTVCSYSMAALGWTLCMLLVWLGLMHVEAKVDDESEEHTHTYAALPVDRYVRIRRP